MLRAMSGKKHEVITSVCLKSTSFQKIINDITIVTFKELSDDEIQYYINNYKPFDKAGGIWNSRMDRVYWHRKDRRQLF